MSRPAISSFLFLLSLILASESIGQCTKDTDCKGDRVCVNGACVVPSTKPAASAQPAISEPASSPTACKIEAPNLGALVMRAGGKLLPMTYAAATVEKNTGGFLAHAFSYGIAKVKATTLLRIDKDRAAFRIQDRQPQLLDLLSPLGSSPDNLYVVRMTAKDNARFVQIATSEANVAGGSASGLLIPDGIRVSMTADTLSPRCTWNGKEYSHYRLTPTTPLDNGEFAFMNGRKFFDFGVDSPQ